MGQLGDYLAKHDNNFRRARLPALYADFRSQRTLNPDGYRANISAWRNALARLAASGLTTHPGSNSGVLIISLDDALRRSLELKEFGQPLALGSVIREAVGSKGLVPLQLFLQSPQNVYQHSWSNTPWNMMGWALQQLGIVDPTRGEDKLPQGTYVVMDNVEAATKELNNKIEDMTSKFDRILTKTQFQRRFAHQLIRSQRLSETDFDVLLRFLARDKNMIAYDGETIRFRETGDHEGITEEDTAISSIKELTENMRRQAELLNSRIDEFRSEAKCAVSRNNRIAALAALKGKKIAEASLSKRYATLHQLDEVAAKVQQAADQVQLIKIMDSSAGVLKHFNAQVGGTDNVGTVMDRLREQMNETDEIAAIMAESSIAVDEGEIDDELEAIERQEREKQEDAGRPEVTLQDAREAADVQKRLEKLPQVPGDAQLETERTRTPTAETGIAKLAIRD